MARRNHDGSMGHGGTRFPEQSLRNILTLDHNRVHLKQIRRREKKQARRTEVAQIRKEKPPSAEARKSLLSHLLHYLNIGKK